MEAFSFHPLGNHHPPLGSCQIVELGNILNREVASSEALPTFPLDEGVHTPYIPSMQKDSKFFADIASMASGLAGSAMDARREAEAFITDKIERLMARGNFVTREEFEVVKAMAEKARAENERLSAELAALKK